MLSWRMRVEPAFGRALDFAVGEGLAGWMRTAQRSGLQLTKKGVTASDALQQIDDVLVDEKDFLQKLAKQITEDFVTRILSGKR